MCGLERPLLAGSDEHPWAVQCLLRPGESLCGPEKPLWTGVESPCWQDDQEDKIIFLLCTGAYGTRSTGDKIENL